MIDEQLSAFLDEESGAAEFRQSIRVLQEDRTYRLAWQRHIWVREVLHGDKTTPALDLEFADRVTAALDAQETDNEKVVPLSRRRRAGRWWQGAAGLAVAASVAAAVVLVVRPFAPARIATPSEPAMVASATSVGTTAKRPRGAAVMQVSNRSNTHHRPLVTNHWAVSDPEVAKLLNSYLLEHSGVANRYGMSGARPSFVRVASYGWDPNR